MAEGSRTALITGCSSGIGRATALRLAGSGWTVHASARNPESIADLTQAGCETLALDVTDEASMAAAVERVESAGPIGALVNNAGYSQSGAVETLTMESLRAQFETNVFGLVRMCQLVLPGMRRAGAGRIVNISSMGGKMTFPGGGAYHGSKHAVEAISDALRFEVRGFGVDVVVVEPGLIKTRFGETAASSLSDADATAAPDSDDPYAGFNAAVGAATVGAYQGPLARLGGEPDAVAKVIFKALEARRPRPRYKVTPSAHLIMAQRRLLTDRAWDAFLSSQFPKPGSSAE
jgi:NAD(P)-dependent dehydrogenase (short-subunit alcohol dehydrogenase family)